MTEPEVAALLDRAGRGALLPAVGGYYNGYAFGGAAVYNPWSILNFLDDSEARLRPYWVTTSSNDLVHDALRRHAFGIQPEIEALLEGATVEQRIDEDVVLGDVTTRMSAPASRSWSGCWRA